MVCRKATQKHQNRPRAWLPSDLNATSATLILAAFLFGEILWVILAGLVALVIARQHDSQSQSAVFYGFLDRTMPGLVVLSPLTGGLFTILASSILVRARLQDNGPNGAAWVFGSWKYVIQGCLTGVLLGLVVCAFTKLTRAHVGHRDIDPLARMALSSGNMRLVAMCVGIILGPITEEILFRGVLFGGYRRSFGTFWAGSLSTLIFMLLHATKAMRSTSAFLGIIVLALVALYYRLRYRSICPAIAVHIAFNGIVALVAVL